MKGLLSVIALIIPLCLQAQSGSNIKKGQTRTLNLYSEKVLLCHLVISDTTKTNTVLSSWKQVKGASGGYITTFSFSTKDNESFYNVNLLLTFDKPVISCEISQGNTEVSNLPNNQGRKTLFELKVARFKADSIPIYIVSDDPIVTTITGTVPLMDE